MEVFIFLLTYWRVNFDAVPFFYYYNLSGFTSSVKEYKFPSLYSSFGFEYTFSKKFFYAETDIRINYIGIRNVKNFKALFFPENIAWFSPKYDLITSPNAYAFFLPKKFYFDFMFFDFTLRVGRFLLPWELNYFFSHFSLFNLYNRFSPFLTEYNGIDGAGLVYSKNFFKLETYWLPIKEDTSRFGARLFLGGRDIDGVFLIERDREQLLLGAGFASNFLNGVLRMEVLLQNNRRTGTLDNKFGVSYDRFFPNNFYFLIEFSGNYDIYGYLPFYYHKTDNILSMMVQKSLNLWTLSLSGFRIFNTKMSGILANLKYDLSDEVDLNSGVFYYDYGGLMNERSLTMYLSLNLNF